MSESRATSDGAAEGVRPSSSLALQSLADGKGQPPSTKQSKDPNFLACYIWKLRRRSAPLPRF